MYANPPRPSKALILSVFLGLVLGMGTLLSLVLDILAD